MVDLKIEKQDSVKLYKLRKTLEELSDKTGHGTELISLYIPPKKALPEVVNTLREEQGTAENIKSAITRKHVLEALSKTTQKLKLYKTTPENGLVIFCGALPPEEGGPPGSEEVKIYELEPPKELRTFLYRCDDHFHVDLLKDMLKEDNQIGFLALDSKDAGWGLLHGNRIEVLEETSSGVSGKHRAGGQSARRFERLREMELTYYFNRIAETTKEYFLDIYTIKGLIISGPGPTKEDFVKQNYLDYRLNDMIIATLDTSYAGSEGVREAFEKAGDVLSNYRLVEEKKLVNKIFEHVHSRSGLVAYGLNEVVDLLKKNVVDTVLITDDTNLRRVEVTCKRCKNVQEEFVERSKVYSRVQDMQRSPCPNCESIDSEYTERDIVDYLALVAAGVGSKVEVISGNTEHGMMLSSLGKIAGLLRYNPNQ